MNNFQVLIIGVGQLGSRHLQALALSQLAMDITVVDPSSDSLAIAKTRYEQMTASTTVGQVKYLTELACVIQNIDLCIIATNASHRLAVLEALVKDHTVTNVVFEKVLFQSTEQLNHASDLLLAKGIKAWVNCPRRMFPIYQMLKSKLANQKSVSMQVKGNDWGLACNAIHFIDLWSLLSGTNDYTIDLSGLSSAVFDSKRPGYKELSGNIAGSANKGVFLLCCALENRPSSVEVTITSEQYQIVVDEAALLCTIKDKVSETQEVVDFKAIYQSSLTHLVAQALYDKGDCALTSYQDSASLHQPFLTALLPFFNASEGADYDVCPIT